MITLYHNPRCSKSRAALDIVQAFAAQHHQDLTLIDYLQTPPDLARLQELAQQVQNVAGQSVRSMLRDGEEAYAQLQLAQANDAQLLAALASHPQLLQRPIIVQGAQARIARPVDGLAQWLLESM